MKRFLFSIIAITCCYLCNAQSTTQSSLALQVVVEDVVEPFPAAGKAQMESKLSTILTRN